MKREICPNCGNQTLEKIEIETEWEWMKIPGYEDWGCSECGNAFFKKIPLDKSPNVCYNTDTKGKEINKMNNFLFVDNNTGERFFVQEEVYEDAYEIALDVVDDEDDLEYIGVFSDLEAECMGYDTY